MQVNALRHTSTTMKRKIDLVNKFKRMEIKSKTVNVCLLGDTVSLINMLLTCIHFHLR